MNGALTARIDALSSSRPFRRVLAAAVALVWILFIYNVYRDLNPRGGRPYVIASAGPIGPRLSEGTWFWIERPRRGVARLVRASDRGAEPVATADEITSYDAGSSGVAWIQRKGSAWSIQVLDARGSRRDIPAQAAPRGLRLVGDRVFWLRPVPGVVSDRVPIPAIQPSLEVVSAPMSGGAETAVARLLETDGQVVGMSGKDLYVLGIRSVGPSNTAIYRIKEGAPPKRIAGESGRSRAILTRDGSLYWTAKSRESSEMNAMSCIRKLGPDGHAVTVTDWMLSDGDLYETDRGLVYVDGFARPSAWPVRGGPPRPMPLSRDYVPLAAGAGDLLLWDVTTVPPRVRLTRMAMP